MEPRSIRKTEEELVKEFSHDFFEEHQYKALFRQVFKALSHDMSPYAIIEQLLVNAEEQGKLMEEIIENRPMKIVVESLEHFIPNQQD